MKAIYIHIPFCNHICTYCDFYKMVAKEELKKKYIDYLIKEIEMKKEYLSDIETIYIGGGTPSSLPLNLLEQLFQTLAKYISLENIQEFTFEANPNDVTIELANLLKKYQVNRISLGVQSLNRRILKILGRKHNKKSVYQAIRILKSVGLTNINADLMYGIGNERFRIIKKDIRRLIKHKVTHLSAYSLIIEEKTIIGRQLALGKFKPMDAAKEARIYRKICSFLTKNNFIHYEISNFCRSGYQSKHNLIYWNNLNYLGVGAGASFYIDNIRYTNIMNLQEYFNGIDKQELNYLETTKLTDEERMSEEMILGLRKLEGVKKESFQAKFGIDIYQKYPFLSDLISKNLIIDDNVFLKVPTDKLYLINEVLVNFI
ncbi:MAG TPA: radical SAM family heme chaperone HemW [Bacilli bacterium]|nr:radical SAM family heme chaperone HemW [Bacilli bacterium]